MAKPAPLVVPYDPEWPHAFEVEQRELAAALAPWLLGGIHHVGSTAVPGLAGKRVIDMLAGVRDLEEARAAFELLGALGYRRHEHSPEAHAFRKPGPGDSEPATHHLHLTEPGSALWRERLAFRDALRGDPALRTEYAAWKRRHAAPGTEPGPYTADKGPFVRRVLAGAGIELAPDSERLSVLVTASERGRARPA